MLLTNVSIAAINLLYTRHASQRCAICRVLLKIGEATNKQKAEPTLSYTLPAD